MTLELKKIFPFLRWFPLPKNYLRADLVAGATVAFVLIPQSMACAQLAGLPAYYGLYAAFLPVILAALWGSSNQLSTGPVAMTSLLTASILAPLAVEGSPTFIELAILLALLAGIIRILLGFLRMGIIVNFLSHPVVLGFTNAAALIIALSQLDKFLGITKIRNGHFLTELYHVILHIEHAHVPTICMGLFTLITILVLRKYKPRMPGVLIAAPATIFISWLIGFENKQIVPVDELPNIEIKQIVSRYQAEEKRLLIEKTELAQRYGHLNGRTLESVTDKRILKKLYDRRKLEVAIQAAEEKNKALKYELLGSEIHYPIANREISNAGADRKTWQLAAIQDDDTVVLSRGGAVVGYVPSGLPRISAPKIDFSMIRQLLPGAFILVLLGLMDVVSVAKVIATKTRQRFDVNQELIGQGVANIIGSFAASFPVSGSFSRSALNLSMGARTGLSSVFTGLVVMFALLFFTPALYHLPESVLAAVIISAVVGLIQFRPIFDMRKVKPLDTLTAVATFVVTLLYAPELEIGVYVGAGLAMLFYLVRRTKPRAVLLGRHWDGTLHDAKTYNLPTCRYIAVFRFDGSLDYADVSYFENMVMDIVTSEPKTKFIHVVCDGVNFIDASGLEMLRKVYTQLLEMDVQMVFSGLKRQIMEVLAVSGFLKTIGRKNIFRTEEEALEATICRIDDPEFDPERCPLRRKDARLLFEKKKRPGLKLKKEAELVYTH